MPAGLTLAFLFFSFELLPPDTRLHVLGDFRLGRVGLLESKPPDKDEEADDTGHKERHAEYAEKKVHDTNNPTPQPNPLGMSYLADP